MKYIRVSDRRKDSKGYHRCYALFECPACKRIVEKRIGHGKKQVTCGCGKGPRQSHGATKGSKRTPNYSIWHSMKQRCYCPTNKSYKRYGGRGIYVCEEWRHDYLAFKAWSERNGYREGLSLDRINNNGPYSPDNCRWVPRSLNAAKRFRDSRLGEHVGASECVLFLCEMLDHIENTGCGAEFAGYLLKIYGSILPNIPAPKRKIIQAFIRHANELQLPQTPILQK